MRYAGTHSKPRPFAQVWPLQRGWARRWSHSRETIKGRKAWGGGVQCSRVCDELRVTNSDFGPHSRYLVFMFVVYPAAVSKRSDCVDVGRWPSCPLNAGGRHRKSVAGADPYVCGSNF